MGAHPGGHVVMLALAEWGSVALAYGIVLVSLLALAVRSAQRGRRLAQQVPEDRRRWM
ncbi:MAG TPA: hypothetical protein VEW93_12120 [Acidimicrobiales bacterium]|nr:hypothetical protein [Acidimicrobiales bacterium]